jgi:hypothetical protein
MRELPRNVSAPAANAKEIRETVQVVRRLEITVERQNWSIEFYGPLEARATVCCPVCGQSLPGSNDASTTEIKT